MDFKHYFITFQEPTGQAYNGPQYSNLSQQSDNKFWPKWFLNKKNQKRIYYAQCMPNYARHKYHLHWLGVHYLKTEISSSSLKDFWSKGEQSEKNV